MTAQTARALISQYTNDLPEDMLQEIVDFIQFVRYKHLKQNPETDLKSELGQLRQQEWAHLEDEFANLDQQYPKQNG